jgi:hypothetical protein
MSKKPFVLVLDFSLSYVLMLFSGRVLDSSLAVNRTNAAFRGVSFYLSKKYSIENGFNTFQNAFGRGVKWK